MSLAMQNKIRELEQRIAKLEEIVDGLVAMASQAAWNAAVEGPAFDPDKAVVGSGFAGNKKQQEAQKCPDSPTTKNEPSSATDSAGPSTDRTLSLGARAKTR